MTSGTGSPPPRPDEEGTTLDGVPGRGYGVVESLPSLGKGRRCTGIFVTRPEHRERFEEARQARRRVPFRGPVHSRQRSFRTELQVELLRVSLEGEGLAVEFTAPGLAYDLGGVEEGSA